MTAHDGMIKTVTESFERGYHSAEYGELCEWINKFAAEGGTKMMDLSHAILGCLLDIVLEKLQSTAGSGASVIDTAALFVDIEEQLLHLGSVHRRLAEAEQRKMN